MMHRANANLFKNPLQNIRKNNHYPVHFLSKTTTRIQEPLTSSSRMSTVLRAFVLFRFLSGLLRTVKMISAGMKQRVKRMEITKYPLQRATTKILPACIISIFTTSKMMVLVLVLVALVQKLNSVMQRRRHKQGSRMSILVLEPIR